MKKIFFIIPRGEVIRNFIYSGILKKLKNKYKVIIISVEPNNEIVKLLKENSDTYYTIKPFNISHYHRYIYQLLNLAHNRKLWSEASKVRWKQRDFEANSFFVKIKRNINKILATIFSNYHLINFLEKYLIFLSKYEKQVKEYINVLNEEKPDLVFNGSHVHSKDAYPIVQAANILKIKTCTFLFSWDNLTSQGRIIPNYNFFLSWNKQIKNDLIKIYPKISKKQIFSTGTPQFSFHFNKHNILNRSQFLEEIGLNKNEKYILYSSGMSHHLPYESDIIQKIAKIIDGISPNLKLVVREYAKDKNDVFKKLKIKNKKIIFPEVLWERKYQTPLLKDQIMFTSMIKHCEMGINVASTISLELCLLNKPVINIGFNPPDRDIYPYDYTRFYKFDHYKPIVDSGAILISKNTDELKRHIIKYLQEPHILEDKRKNLIKNFFNFNSISNINNEMKKPIFNIIDSFEKIIEKT